MLEKWPTCDYFMFMEDDFVLCDKTMEAVSHALAKSSAYSPDWSALRISYGKSRDLFKHLGCILPRPAAIIWVAFFQECQQ